MLLRPREAWRATWGRWKLRGGPAQQSACCLYSRPHFLPLKLTCLRESYAPLNWRGPVQRLEGLLEEGLELQGRTPQ